MPESDDLMRAGEEALQSARLLVEHNLWADAISRAYYAMVYATRALLGEKGHAPKTHRGAIQLFGREFVQPGTFSPDVAKLLTTTMAFRERADYGLRGDLAEADARRTVDAAERFLNTAGDVLKKMRK